MWKLIFDEINKEMCMIAYADDGVIVVEGELRRDLEQKACQVMEKMNEWCVRAKMMLSKSKTVCMLLKGGMNVERLPIYSKDGG